MTVERAFGALKNRFKILYNKPFHPYKTQVKLVLHVVSCTTRFLCFGVDDVVPLESEWEANPANVDGPNDNVIDNNAWATKRDTWAQQMWQARHGVH